MKKFFLMMSLLCCAGMYGAEKSPEKRFKNSLSTPKNSPKGSPKDKSEGKEDGSLGRPTQSIDELKNKMERIKNTRDQQTEKK